MAALAEHNHLLAVALDDPTKWELGRGTYTSSTGTFDRSDAEVFLSSNSGNRVNFLGSNSEKGGVLIQGIATVSAKQTALTVSVGTGSTTIADVGAAFSQSTLNNNFRSLADAFNNLLTALQAAGIQANN